MKNKEEIIFKTVREDNILPITSICKLNCIFCSHKNNPPEVETYSFGHLDFELVKTMIEFLNPQKPVFIGESASKIIEGEPFVHPNIYQILKYLRQRWPKIEIKITTSGSFVDLNKIKLFKSLKPLELNISLNAPAPSERVFLMNDSRPKNVFKLIPALKENEINFEASIVSMHHLKGFKYLKASFDFLESYPPQSLRVFMPGFSSFAAENLILDQGEYYKLNQFIKSEKENYSYPIIIEPQLIKTLKAEIKAVLANSPADAVGLESGMIILEVNHQAVKTRVDAFYKIKTAKNPILLCQNGNEKFVIKLIKEKEQSSGLIMSYDLSLTKKRKLEAYIKESYKKAQNKATVILTSVLAYDFIREFLAKYLNSNYNLDLIKAKNNFFGGSIVAAGLLCNQDLIQNIKTSSKQKIERIILPQIIYDYYGNDLLGEHYNQLEDYFKAEVILI
ncbi:DUF512 domain-containing protein [Halanaerobium praevalens]|uniref:Radical SAM domain protein n=1 Tax=Halanaerobium praevalens (strain ATCC 33744 / DSM 2228 / GSL) TaxID=572479 RepID=E3DPI3_HALPG|nr:DUF512 domain-containing protein [Halanaerobium praevalens]ADO77745.1 Radical SAM domain protein [Halanaerobium praevalens DSM 2228]